MNGHLIGLHTFERTVLHQASRPKHRYRDISATAIVFNLNDLNDFEDVEKRKEWTDWSRVRIGMKRSMNREMNM